MMSTHNNDMEMSSETQSLKQEHDYTENRSVGRERAIFEITSSNGLWQFRVFLVLFVVSIPGAGENFAVSFMAPNIDYWCARPPEASNVSVEMWKKAGLPPNDKHCSRFSNLTFPLDENHTTSGLITVPCESWEYDHTFYTSTILEEFDLVCDHEWFISLSKSVFMAGLLVSMMLFGSLSDKFGRRPIITGCCILSFISGGICAFSTSFTMYFISRFFVAMGFGGHFNNLFVLLMEVLGPNLRYKYSNAVHLGWSVGFVCLPGIVWLLRDWFWIQIALTSPYVIFLAVWWMIPESPRWLLSQGKADKATEILLEAAKMNKRKISDIDKKLEDVVSDANEDCESEERTWNFLDLLRTPGLRQITLNIVFTWFVTAFIYFGLSFNTNDLAGDSFVNFAAFGAVEFPAYSFSILAIRYFGRKKSMAGTMLIAGLICLLSYFVPENPSWLRSVFPMIGKFFITSCHGVIYVFTMELFPTVVRSSGLGLSSFFEMIGSITAPFVRELGIATQPYVPFIIFGILACMSGLLTMLLPETSDKKMPDTIKEAARASR